MQRNISINVGEHFQNFVTAKIKEGRFESTSEAIRAGLRLLEIEETKLELLSAKLSEGENQLDHNLGVDGEDFMNGLF